MIAKYGGECPRCGMHFPAGTPISKRDDMWYPDVCPGCQKRDHEVPTKLHELLGLLKLHPYNQQGSLFELKCASKFEGHGHASETFELHWYLELYTYPYYWRGTNGWNKGNDGLTMSFHGETVYEVIGAAIRFVRDMEAMRASEGAS